MVNIDNVCVRMYTEREREREILIQWASDIINKQVRLLFNSLFHFCLCVCVCVCVRVCI